MEIEEAKEIIKKCRDKTCKNLESIDYEALDILMKGLDKKDEDKICLNLMFEKTIENSIICV